MNSFRIGIVSLVLAFAIALPIGAEEVSSDQIILKSEEVEVRLSEITNLIRILPRETRAQVLSNEDQLLGLIENYYVTKWLEKYALDKGLDQDEKVRTELKRQQMIVLSNAAIQHYVKAESAADYALVARERYDSAPERFRVPPERSASHILLEVGEEGEAAALEKMRDIRGRIEAGDASFEDMAREYSQDSVTAGIGGDLGWFKRTQMVKPFADAAFSLEEIGQISEPVKSSFGYHIIRLDGIKEGRLQSYEEVKDQLIAEISRDHAKTLKAEFIKKIRTNSEVEFEDSVIQQIMGTPQDG